MKFSTDAVTLKMDKNKCTGCGLCIEVCPRQVFALREKKADLVFLDSCIECGACQRNCAFGALSVDTGISFA